MIEKNGGKASGLDFSDKQFENGIDLSDLDLSGIIFRNAELAEAHFERSILFLADLQSAFLDHAHLNEAILVRANLEHTWLINACLEGVHLHGCKISSETHLEFVNWGNYIIRSEKNGIFGQAEVLYRRLKNWYTERGIYDIAGKFYFREMTVKRKALKWWPNPLNRLFSKMISILCGYGEKPERVAISAAVIIFGLATAYYFGGTFNSSSFLSSLYYSVVSFVALGYGNWVTEPIGWAKYMGAVEAATGVFMMALFLVTFTRKMTR